MKIISLLLAAGSLCLTDGAAAQSDAKRKPENTLFNFQPGTPPYGKYKLFSYRVETPERTFLFTSHTGPSDVVTALAKGADVLVTEMTSVEDVIDVFRCTGARQAAKTEDKQTGWIRHMKEEHVSPKDVGEMASKAGIKTVVMTHLGPSVRPDDDYQRFADEAKKYFAGQVVVAKDLMEF
jgi:ribonuclease BN (tRNA processing enzyme)